MGIYFAWIRLLRRLVMNIFGLGKKRLSFKASAAYLPTVLDPLDFLSAEPPGIGSRVAFDQIHAAIHESLSDCEKGIQLILEQLSPEGNIGDRVILEANNQIRNELNRAVSIAGHKRNELIDTIYRKLELIYIQSLIQYPHQDPEIRKWDSLGPRAVIRELPAVTEYTFSDLAQGGSDRDKRLKRWGSETDQWLDCLALNHTAEVIKKLDEYLKEFMASWIETSNAIRRRAGLGGSLFQRVVDADNWSFDSEDPATKNLLTGGSAQDIALLVLDRFNLAPLEYELISEAVREALRGTAIFGTTRVSTEHLEDTLAMAIAEKIKDTVSIESGFLSMLSGSAREQSHNSQLSQTLVEMYRGAAAMEQKMFRVGEVGIGHVDSAAGVGVSEASVHDEVLRSLGGARRFAAVEGHPDDTHRFVVQMSVVGASLSDLTTYSDMMTSWYQWHFEEDRGQCHSIEEWVEAVKAQCWKLYPDIGVSMGVRSSIVELMNADFIQHWESVEGLPTFLTNGLPDEKALLGVLWGEMGLMMNGSHPNADGSIKPENNQGISPGPAQDLQGVVNPQDKIVNTLDVNTLDDI